MVEAKQKLKDQKFPAIIISAAIGISLLLGVFITRPLYLGVRKNATTLKEKNSILQSLEVKLVNLKKMKEKESELKEKNDKVLASLPQDKDVSRLFTQFENVARESGFSITRVSESNLSSAATPTSTELLKNVLYSVSGDATNYASFKDALNKLNQALRLLNVSEISLTDSAGNLDVVLSVNAYVRGVK